MSIIERILIFLIPVLIVILLAILYGPAIGSQAKQQNVKGVYAQAQPDAAPVDYGVPQAEDFTKMSDWAKTVTTFNFGGGVSETGTAAQGGTTGTGAGNPVPEGGLPADPIGKDQTADVHGIIVFKGIAPQVEAMIAAAERDGISLGGSGWRDVSDQIALREQNCGTSQYDIYQKPSGECDPPTAIPGRSNHERGLAIDFRCNGSGMSSGDACFNWLSTHAVTYGFYNLPSEPWHWSTNGS